MKFIFQCVLLILICLRFKQVSSNFLLGRCPQPPNFPSIIRFNIKQFETYDKYIKVPFAYVVTPRFPEEVVTLANWAYQNGYRIRPMGNSHSWAPLQFAPSDSGVYCPNTILVDMTKYFTSMSVNPTDYGRPDLHSVTVGSGVTLRHLLEFLEENGLGVFASPTIGPVTVGGMLAVAAHGTGMPSKFDKKSTGHSYGTFSNLVIDMTIVAWDSATSSYKLKTLYRWEKDCKAFLTNLGRTVVTSVTLRVGLDQNLRSQSHFFIPSNELFASPYEVTESTRTVAKFADSYGRVNPIGLLSGKLLWVMTWKFEPMKPPKSRAVNGPFNYYFMNYFPEIIEPALRRFLTMVPSFSEFLGLIGYPLVVAGTNIVRSVDYWGPSKNHLLIFTSFSPHLTPYSFTIVTSKANIQLVVWILKSHYDGLLREYAKKGHFPNPGEFNIRITGVDNPDEIEIPGAESPSFSGASMLPEYPDYDVVIWFESSGYLETPSGDDFLTQLQTLILRDIHEKIGILRLEWAKGWASTFFGPYKNTTIMNQIIPRGFSSSDRMEEWNWAVSTLDRYDPHRIFSNSFLDQLLVLH